MSLLRITDASYTYPQTKKSVLRNINLEVNGGDYIALLGANGSGKSTLARMVAGFFEPDSGKVFMDKDVLPGIVFQQPKDQIVAGVVERDTAFGPQNLNLTKSEIELRTIECLSVIGLADRASSRTFELSLGQTQRLAFSGILALFPDLLILDEVTAMLDPGARKELVQFVDQWNVRGHAIIHVTHDLDEALRAKRIVVLDKGEIVFDGTRSDFEKNESLVEKIFGTPVDENTFEKKPCPEGEQISLEVKNLSFSYPDRTVFKDVSFSLKKGSLVALTGASGCGKSTLFECLSGLLAVESGTVNAVSRPVLALQESEASLFERYAADDVAFGPMNQGMQGKELLARVRKSMELAGLDYKEFGNRPTYALSGGEKRKLSIAGIIALDSDIMIFDEPTSALDPGARKTVLGTLRALANEGKTVLFSTHRMEEALVADVQLKWTELTQSQEAPAAESKLTLQEPIPNAKIISSLRKGAQSFMAPPVVKKSLVSSLPAWVKSLLFLVIFVAGLSSYHLWMCGAMLLVNVIYALCARYPLKKPVKAFWKLAPWILVFALIQFVVFPVQEGDVILYNWRWFNITYSKLEMLGKAFIRGFSAIFSIGTFIYSTSEREILDGISDLLKPLALMKIPVRYFVLVIGIIFRFIPLLIDELCGIFKTQIVRGAFAHAKGFGKIKIIIPLFVPVILDTFRKAQNLSDALTARYFN